MTAPRVETAQGIGPSEDVPAHASSPSLGGAQARCQYPRCASAATAGKCSICDEHVCKRHLDAHAGFVRLDPQKAGA